MVANSPAENDGEFREEVTVLLVDDDEEWTRGTARLLEHNTESFSVETAYSLDAGRERYADCDPDCIVCDHQLGDGTGLGLLETVRTTDEDVPFILVTGRGDEAVASEAIREGTTEYIIKDQDSKEAELLTNRITSAVRTYRAEKLLERERRSKNALLELLTAGTDELTLFEECCTLLVDEHGYDCAWIGIPIEEETLVSRAVAGDEAYVEDLIHAQGVDENPVGDPALASLDANETVVYSASEDSEWATRADPYGFESAAGVPVSHQGVLLGVLGVYTAGQPRIDENRLEMLEEFTETVGYAVNTAEFKRSLLSEQPIGLSIELPAESIPLVALQRALGADCRLTVPSVVLRDDGATLYLANIEHVSPETVRRAIEAESRLELAAEDSFDAADDVRCGVVVDSETPESLLAEQGADLERIVVENGVATVTARVPNHERVSTIDEMLQSKYDGAEVTSLRQTQQNQHLGTVTDLLEPLTDKQENALRQAYYEGYFEHPRDATATELSNQFGVSRQTMAYHLRVAERKVFDQVFEQ